MTKLQKAVEDERYNRELMQREAEVQSRIQAALRKQAIAHEKEIENLLERLGKVGERVTVDEM